VKNLTLDDFLPTYAKPKKPPQDAKTKELQLKAALAALAKKPLVP
jgi:hypothetical protein